MTDEQREEKREQFKRIINDNVMAIVRDAMGFNATGKTSFKTKVTFQKLIDYKFAEESETRKFELFMSMADNIVENIQIMFPFINLEGIDLSWTTEELQDKIFEIFEMTPEMNLQNCPRKSEEERKLIKKENNKKIKELETKLETYLRQFCNIPENDKFPKRDCIYQILKKYVHNVEEHNEKRTYCDRRCIQNNNGDRENLPSLIELDIKILFPEAKDIYLSAYSTFSNIMGELKKANNIR